MPLVIPELHFLPSCLLYRSQTFPTRNLLLRGVASRCLHVILSFLSIFIFQRCIEQDIIIMTAKCSNFSLFNMASNLSPKPDNELPPHVHLNSSQMNSDKIETSASIYGNKKALSIFISDMSNGRRRRRDNEEDLPASKLSTKRQRYQRRNSKVASMLHSSVNTVGGEEQQSFHFTTSNDCSANTFDETRLLESDDEVEEPQREDAPPTKKRRKSS